ncbi:hypothetical protein C1646_767932, partial [Rhizophagus diaphanus]
MQQLALNYINLSSVLMVQQSTPQNVRPKPNNNNNQNRHISRNCQIGRNNNNSNNNNNRPQSQRPPITPINYYADDEAEIYYDEYEDEYEEEWEEEDGYEAYEDQLRTQSIPPVTSSKPMDLNTTAKPSTKRKIRTKMVPAPIENVNEFDIAKYI